MSRFSGPQGGGAMRLHRQAKRVEAVDRQASGRIRDEARRQENAKELAQWRLTPEGRAAKRFKREFEKRLRAAGLNP